jgi:hypothetical protein
LVNENYVDDMDMPSKGEIHNLTITKEGLLSQRSKY